MERLVLLFSRLVWSLVLTQMKEQEIKRISELYPSVASFEEDVGPSALGRVVTCRSVARHIRVKQGDKSIKYTLIRENQEGLVKCLDRSINDSVAASMEGGLDSVIPPNSEAYCVCPSYRPTAGCRGKCGECGKHPALPIGIWHDGTAMSRRT